MKSLYVSRRGKSWEESCSLMYPCSFPIRIINMTHHDPDPAPSSEEFTNYAWVEDCGLADLRGKLGVSSDLRNLPSFWGHAGAFIKSFFTIDDVTTFWISLRILIQQLQLTVLRFFWMMWDDNLNWWLPALGMVRELVANGPIHQCGCKVLTPTVVASWYFEAT